MTSFQQFRIWLRRASTAERTSTLVAAAVATALVGWLLAPSGGVSQTSSLQSFGGSPGSTSGTGGSTGFGSSSSGTTGVGTTSSGTTGAGTTGAGTSGAGTSGSGTTGGGGKSTAGGTTSGSGRQCPGAPSGQGVTDSKIDVAITIIDIAGAAGNDAVGVPSPAEQQSDWQQIAGSINASGGTACRKLALHFFSVNPLSTDGANRSCLDIAASKPFVVLDTGALTQVSASDCVPSAQIPLVSAYVSEDQLKKYYPYYLSPLGTQADGYRTNYKAAAKNGYFSASKGFKKLGIMYKTCRPGLVAAGRDAIRAAGVPDSATVTYNLGCTPGGTAMTDFQQAAVSFKQQGVTTVTHLDENNYAEFTQAAAQQGYKPQYVVAQDQDANKTTGAYAPDAANLDGALAVIGGRYGEQDTPGFRPSAGTEKCNAIYAKFNQKPVYQQGAGYGGVVCTYLWFIAGALDHISSLQRNAVVSGMRGIGTLDSAFPFGPISYTALPAGTPYGTESWRVDQYSKDCSCWKVLDSTFKAPLR